MYFCAVYDYAGKAKLSKGCKNRKRNLDVTTHFSEIIELKFGKKIPYNEKRRDCLQFSFWIPIALVLLRFALRKNTLVLGCTFP